ncbi:MAG: sensor histidine kinase, partial [Bacteroidota bacterium]
YDASSLWFTTAMVYFYQAKLDSAKVCLKRSVSVVDTLPYPNSRCVSNLNLAFLHNIIGQPVTALEYAQAALTDAESIADVPLTAMVHQIFSYTFLVLRKPELCIQYGEQALKIGKHQMIAADLALLYMTVAQAYYLKQNIAKGDAYLDSSHQINERIEDPQGLYQVELTRAQMALEVQQEPEKALRILRATTEKFPLGQPGFALNNLERKAIEIRALFMGEYWEEAEAKIQSAYQDASFQQITQLHLFAQLAQTLLLAHKGDKAAAIQQLLAYEQQRDSLYQGQAMERTSRLETQFKVQNIRDQLALTEKEKQLAEEEKTLVRQRWQVITLAVGAVGSILLALALVFFRSRQRARRDAAHIRELSKEVHHRTKNNLQMLNSLLNLQMDRQPEGSEVHQALDSTKTRVAAISRLHHLLYDNDQLTRISLPELVQNLTKDLRETAGLTEADVQIQTAIFPIQVDAGRAVPLTLILNEWLTNAFKYAVPTTEAPTILIEFKQLGNERMMLVFSDNGPGYDPSQRREGSYGTDLVRTMVRQLHGHLDMNTINGTQYLLQFRNPTTS